MVATVRKANEGIACYIARDCICGGQPRISLIRGRKLKTFVMDLADVFKLETGDIVGTYCTVCEQMIDLDWIEL